ncbi:hypothetical protein JFR03_001032 [Aeromonas veronii]|nr:hypothetical protein [Aeromonas veronii]
MRRKPATARWPASADRLGEKAERAALVARFFIHFYPFLAVWELSGPVYRQLLLLDMATALSIDEQLFAAQLCASPLSG